MKKFSLLPLAAAVALIVSCGKPQSEADRNAQIEREVQQRLTAERQADEQKRLTQQQADLAAREKALADKEAAATAENTERTATPRTVTRSDEDADSQPPVASSDREAPRSYDTFYRKLEPYGAWRETDEYGYVWQPRASQQSRDWRPYTNGRWAYTDAGWTWISEEPFGWATYHYGRWTRLRNVGWVWVPGEEWAPAWVSWRSGERNVGWAPLPPEARFERNVGIQKWADSYYDISADEYVFIPNEDIGSDRIESAVIPVERNVTIVNETINVTNITYNNITIVNEGPNFDQLRGRSRRPLERMRLQREYDVQRDGSSQAVVRGGAITMVTPRFSARAVGRPRNVGEPIRQVQVERNWTNNANQPDAERARARMKSEATPPPNAPPKRFQKPTVLATEPAPSPVASVAAPTPPPSATASAAPIVATPLPTATPAVSASPMATATPAATAIASPSPMAPTPRPTRSPRMTPPVPIVSPTLAPAVTAPPKTSIDDAAAMEARREAELKRQTEARAKAQEFEQRRAAEQTRRAEEARERQRKMDVEREPPQIAPPQSDGAPTTPPAMRKNPARPVMTPRALPPANGKPDRASAAYAGSNSGNNET